MWVRLLCESSAKCKTENRCEKVSPTGFMSSDLRKKIFGENFTIWFYVAAWHTFIHRRKRDLQHQLMGGAFGPMIFNCWRWERVGTLDEEFRMNAANHLDCHSLKFSLLVLLQQQPLCVLPNDYCVRRLMLQMTEGSAFTKTFEVWFFWLTPIKTLRPSTSALVV